MRPLTSYYLSVLGLDGTTEAEAMRSVRHLVKESADAGNDDRYYYWENLQPALTRFPAVESAILEGPPVLLGLWLISSQVTPAQLEALAPALEADVTDLQSAFGEYDAWNDHSFFERFSRMGPRTQLELLATGPRASSDLLAWASSLHLSLGVTPEEARTEVSLQHPGLGHLMYLLAGDTVRACAEESAWGAFLLSGDLFVSTVEAAARLHPGPVCAYLDVLLEEHAHSVELQGLAARVLTLAPASPARTALSARVGLARAVTLVAPDFVASPTLEDVAADLSLLEHEIEEGTLDVDDMLAVLELSQYSSPALNIILPYLVGNGHLYDLVEIARRSNFEPRVLQVLASNVPSRADLVADLVSARGLFPGAWDVFPEEVDALIRTSTSVLMLAVAERLGQELPCEDLVLAGPARQLFDSSPQHLVQVQEVLLNAFDDRDWDAFEVLAADFDGSLGDLVLVVKES